MKESKVVQALEKLAQASLDVLVALEQDDEMLDKLNGELNHYYPYTESFDEIVSRVQSWSDVMKLAHQGKTVAEIDKDYKFD